MVMEEDIFFQRHSTRDFLAKEVSSDNIEEIIKAGCYAPSSKNRQPWKFVVLRGEVKNESANILINVVKEKIEQEGKIKYGVKSPIRSAQAMMQAPVVIFVFNNCCKNDAVCLSSDIFSIGAAVENIMLKAALLGMSSLCIGDVRFADSELRMFLNESHMLVCAVAIGYEKKEHYNNMKNRRKNYTYIE